MSLFSDIYQLRKIRKLLSLLKIEKEKLSKIDDNIRMTESQIQTTYHRDYQATRKIIDFSYCEVLNDESERMKELKRELFHLNNDKQQLEKIVNHLEVDIRHFKIDLGVSSHYWDN